MIPEQALQLQPGDRVLVTSPRCLAPEAMPPQEAVFVGCADDPRLGKGCMVVCGLPEGFPDDRDQILNCTALWLEEVLSRPEDVVAIEGAAVL